jgi:hypothetical protein
MALGKRNRVEIRLDHYLNINMCYVCASYNVTGDWIVCMYVCMYEVVSKIFRTGAAIYTAVVVARSTSPNRPNCELRVLLQRFAATA